MDWKMAVAFTRASLWLWGGSGKDHHHEPASGGPPLSGSSDFGFREPDNVKFPPGKGAKMRSARPRPKWQSREERWGQVDRELDVVLVPSDGGGCLSGSESDDSDWSIGWPEPHASDFFGDAAGGGGEAEVDTGFAVLVRCYGRGRCERVGESSSNKKSILGAIDFSDRFSYEVKNSVEQWLASL